LECSGGGCRIKEAVTGIGKPRASMDGRHMKKAGEKEKAIIINREGLQRHPPKEI